MSKAKVFILPDETIVSFIRDAYLYAAAQYGNLEANFKSKDAYEFLNELKQDPLLTVIHFCGGYRILSKNIPEELKKRSPVSLEGIEQKVNDEDKRRDREFDDANLPEGVDAVNWQ